MLYKYLLYILAIVALASCNNTPQNATVNIGQGTYEQPIVQPLSLIPKKLNWNKIKPISAIPVVSALNINNLPSHPYDTAEFKPFSNSITEAKFDFNSLPSKYLDIDKLPSKRLKYTVYTLPPPKFIKAGLPQLKDPSNPFIYGLGAVQGLQGTVRNIIKDNDGFFWILTTQYLYRYDGENLLQYQSLDQPNYYFFMVDSQGRIWLSKYDEIEILDIKKGTVTILDIGSNSANNYILDLFQDRQSRVWVTSNSGVIYIIDKKNETIKSVNTTVAIPGKSCPEIVEDSQNKIWLPTLGGGVEIIDPAKKKITYFDKAHGLSNDSVTTIAVGQNNCIWLGCKGNVLHAVDQQKSIIKNIKEFKQPVYFESLLNDKNGNIWVGTKNGSQILDTIRHLTKYLYTGNGLIGNYVRKILQDKDGQIWISTTAGISIVNHNEHIIEQIGNIPTTALYEDKQRLLWQASPYTGFNIIDRKHKTQRHFGAKDGLDCDSVETVKIMGDQIFLCTNEGLNIIDKSRNTLTYISKKQGLSSTTVNVVAKDRTGNLWIGGDKGVDVYDPQKKQVKRIGKPELSDENIIDITQDSLGRMWVSTYRGGINVFDLHSGSISFLNNVQGLNTFPKSFCKDNNGNIWISSERGVSVVDLKRGKLLTLSGWSISRNEPIANILHKNQHIYLSGYNGINTITLPAATADYYKKIQVRSYGINKLNRTFFQTDAISDDSLYYLGDAGITVLDLSKKKAFIPTVYVSGIIIKDTLQYFVDRSRSDIRATDTVWNQDGTKYTTGEALFQKTDLLKTNMSYDNVSGPYNMPVNLTLPYNKNYISFNFTSFGKAEADSALYSYKLKGIDNNWATPTTATTSNTYYGLAPGEYTFEVSRFIENEWCKPAIYSFIISPPWWQTWWAYILYLLLFIGVVWCFGYYRSQQLVKTNRVLEHKVTVRTEEVLQQKEEIEAQRDHLEVVVKELKTTQSQLIQSEKMASLGELTAGIAHEIQNPLNFVNNFSEVNKELIDEMQQAIDTNNLQEVKALAIDIRDNQDKITVHGKRADSIVKGMLQHSKTGSSTKEPANINTIADEFMRLAYHGLRAKDKSFNAELVTNFDENLPLVNIVQQDIGRVLLNLFNNAFYDINKKKKTAPSDYKPEVSVSTFKDKNQVFIKVKDNGNGIPEAIKDKIMQPFFTTKPTGEGTGLGLSLSYDIVVKGHGGSINVTSVAGEGSEFVITLPII